MKKLSMLLAVGWLAVGASAQDPTHTPDFEALGQRWEAAASQLRVPGFALVVLRGDEVLCNRTFGVRDIAGNKPVTEQTSFYIASCTKLFVATQIMMLVAGGDLALDDPVRKHLPRFELVV